MLRMEKTRKKGGSECRRADSRLYGKPYGKPRWGLPQGLPQRTPSLPGPRWSALRSGLRGPPSSVRGKKGGKGESGLWDSAPNGLETDRAGEALATGLPLRLGVVSGEV